MTTAIEAIDHLTAAVSYLRVQVGAQHEPADGPATDWFSCAELCADQGRLLDLSRSTAAGRGTDRDDVAMSLLVQGYAFRIASVAIGAWLLDEVVLDVAPARCAIAIGRHRPNAVRLETATIVAAPPTLGSLHAELIDAHLARLVVTAHGACRVGEALLWSNVAAACASSFGAFMAPLHERRAEVRDRAEAFFAAARPELARSGRLVPVGSAWAWERQACCLWYRTDSGSRCADCSLWTDAERAQRYQDATDAEVSDARGAS